MGNNVFAKTQQEILKVFEANMEKGHAEIWKIIKERFPNVPEYILRSCLEELCRE